MVFNRPIIIRKLNEDTEQWEDYISLKSRKPNKSKGSEYLSSGAIQSTHELVFEVRYCTPLKVISLNTQSYSIIYDGVVYDILDYDNFKMENKTVKLLGVARND